jgi:hypothetical protein
LTVWCWQTDNFTGLIARKKSPTGRSHSSRHHEMCMRCLRRSPRRPGRSTSTLHDRELVCCRYLGRRFVRLAVDTTFKMRLRFCSRFGIPDLRLYIRLYGLSMNATMIECCRRKHARRMVSIVCICVNTGGATGSNRLRYECLLLALACADIPESNSVPDRSEREDI